MFSEWRDVLIGEYFDVDLDKGLETKVVYNKTKQPHVQARINFCIGEDRCRYINLQLWDGRCAVYSCREKTLNLSTAEGEIPWILKFYKRGRMLRITLNGEENLEFDTKMDKLCSSFWASENISKVTFPGESEGVVTQYRIAESHVEDDERDNFTGNILQITHHEG